MKNFLSKFWLVLLIIPAAYLSLRMDSERSWIPWVAVLVAAVAFVVYKLAGQRKRT